MIRIASRVQDLQGDLAARGVDCIGDSGSQVTETVRTLGRVPDPEAEGVDLPAVTAVYERFGSWLVARKRIAGDKAIEG